MPNFYPGYLTPDSVPFDDHCRTFRIPNDVQWLSVFMGALLPLIYPESWQKYGTLTPDESAEVMLNVIWDAYADDEGICPVLPAPYWDTYANVDDQEPEGADEVWYGELVPAAALSSSRMLLDDELTWRENLGIWAIAGFIAYSGQIAGAIAFVPFARRFVLKFRGNPLGAIAEIFIDGIKLATLDTASDEDRIKAIDIQLPDDDEHTVWVAVGEDSPEGSTLQVVRKELAPGEVYPTNLRYNPDTDTVQQTYDGGSTWVDQPGQDPRHATTYQFPPVVADDPKCQAASNMSLFFANLIGTVLDVISTGLDALGVATSIMPLFVELGPFAILFDLGLGLGAALIGLGADVITAEFTPEVFEALTCVFYCHIGEDGSVTSEQLSAINAQIEAQFNPDVFLIMAACFLLMGEVGLSNAGTTGGAPADCSGCDCGWCEAKDWTPDDTLGGWTVTRGTWAEGDGWDGIFVDTNSKSSAILDAVPAAATRFTSITIIFSGDFAGANGGARIQGYLSGSQIFNVVQTSGGSHVSFTWSGDEMLDEIVLLINSGSSATQCKIEGWTGSGLGTAPGISDVCP